MLYVSNQFIEWQIIAQYRVYIAPAWLGHCGISEDQVYIDVYLHNSFTALLKFVYFVPPLNIWRINKILPLLFTYLQAIKQCPNIVWQLAKQKENCEKIMTIQCSVQQHPFTGQNMQHRDKPDTKDCCSIQN